MPTSNSDNTAFQEAIKRRMAKSGNATAMASGRSMKTPGSVGKPRKMLPVPQAPGRSAGMPGKSRKASPFQSAIQRRLQTRNKSKIMGKK